MLKAFRERRVGVSKESIYDPVKVRNAIRVLKELLAAKGHPNAIVEEEHEEVSATSLAITFVINEGERVRVVEIQFEGNTVFSDGKLRGAMKYVKEAGLITRFKGQDILDREKLDFDLHTGRQLHAVEGLSSGAPRRAASRRRGPTPHRVSRSCRCRSCRQSMKACASPFRSSKESFIALAK